MGMYAETGTVQGEIKLAGMLSTTVADGDFEGVEYTLWEKEDGSTRRCITGGTAYFSYEDVQQLLWGMVRRLEQPRALVKDNGISSQALLRAAGDYTTTDALLRWLGQNSPGDELVFS